MTHNTELTILSTAIRQDVEGRYCLNDCHRAAGGIAKDAPAQWLRTDSARKLVAELETMQNCTVSETAGKPVEMTTGRNGGTYAVKELVYAYAMWISPAFHLKVIRAFDALVTGRIPEQKPKRIRKPAFDVAFERCLRVASHLSHLDENQRLLMAARGTKELSGVNPLELMGVTSIAAPTQDNYLTPTQIGKEIGLSPIATNRLITTIGYQVKSSGSSVSSDYSMTEAGAKHGRMFDTTRRHGKGSQQQLKWSPNLVGILRAAMLADKDAPRPFAKAKDSVPA
nr:KilA-N domain-containing protein [Novacetimonas hansenii]